MIIAGNWKMNLLQDGAIELTRKLIENNPGENDVIIFPPFLHIPALVKEVSDSKISIGSQDCHYEESGAFTGDVSASLIKESGCKYSLVGHSERRQYHNETSKIVCQKAQAAFAAGLIPIICVGETLEDRENEETESVIEEQLDESIPKNFDTSDYILAYEPVWAIGTGLTASTKEIAEVHNFIASYLGEGSKILYGGSVNDENCDQICSTENVDGVLVGGASLKADKFTKIMNV